LAALLDRGGTLFKFQYTFTPEGFNMNTAPAGCCLSAAVIGRGMSSARQAFFIHNHIYFKGVNETAARLVASCGDKKLQDINIKIILGIEYDTHLQNNLI
jgi:hypothetical protein